MKKGIVVSGDFSKIIMRVKSGMSVELGELLVIESKDGSEKFIMQVYDLVYGSQLSSQNLEMVAGMNLEEGSFDFYDKNLRNYHLCYLKPILTIDQDSKNCKKLPAFFSDVRAITKDDLKFIAVPKNPLYLGNLRSGSHKMDFDITIDGREVLSHHVLIPASTGKGKSNLMSTMLWNIAKHDYAGILVMDPHDEYYGRAGVGLKDHPNKEKIVYYTPVNPPVGSRTLKVNLKKLKPEYFSGAIALSEPQKQSLYVYYKMFKEDWIEAIIEERKIEGVRFHEDTMAVIKRKLITLLNLSYENGKISTTGIFDLNAGENTISQICSDLENGKIVIVDTSFFAGAIEIMVGSMIASEMFNKYKYYKRRGELDLKPVVSVVLEEAPRVLGKRVLEQGSNIFETIAREGRKFKIGIIAITQIPSEIPKNILANMNTKIILGLEMNSERQSIIESSPQDLSSDNRNIASLNKGEAIVTSTFTKFALPITIPFFNDVVKRDKKIFKDEYKMDESLFG